MNTTLSNVKKPRRLRDILRPDLWSVNTAEDLFPRNDWNVFSGPLFSGLSSEQESFDRTYEKNGNFVIEIVRPFAKKEDFKVEWRAADKTLKVLFAKETTEENSNGSSFEMTSTFEREFTVANTKQDSKIETKFEGSTLTVFVPIDPNVPNVTKGFTEIEIQ